MQSTSLLEAESAPLIDLGALTDRPHAMFRDLRARYPFVRIGSGQYIALRADDVLALLTDSRIEQMEGEDYAKLGAIPDGAVSRFISDFFLLANGREHRSRRGLFARSFTLGRIRARQGEIRSVADAIAGSLPRSAPFDFIDRMAARVPAEMIARLLGLRIEDAPFFSHRVYALAQAFTPTYPHARHEEIERAATQLFGYVEDEMAQRLALPRDDLLSALLQSWGNDRAISFESLVHQVIGVIIGGVDTTRAAFAMLVSLLLQHPQQWEAVKADRSLIPGAISEALRYEPSVGSVARTTTDAITVGRIEVPAGSLLRLSTMSAMRDPSLYADPDRFDIRREDHPRLHAVFGHGPHRCLGEMLARFEMEEALAALIETAPDIELVTPPRMLGFGGIRQITPMTVLIP